MDHSHAANERHMHEDPANDESSDLDSALNNPYGLDTVVEKLDVADNAGSSLARVAGAALPPDESSDGHVDESTPPSVGGADDDDDSASEGESADGPQGAGQQNETKEEVEQDSGDMTRRLVPTLLNMTRPEKWPGLLDWDLRFNESVSASDLVASKFDDPRDWPVGFAG